MRSAIKPRLISGKKISIILGFLVYFCLVFEAWGGQKKSEEFIGAYVGAGTNFQTSGSFNFGFKLRYLKYCPVGFEFVDMVPYGNEIAFPFYLIHHPNFKFHIIMPFTGFHIPWMKTRMSIDWVRRKKHIDLVMGAGVELQFKSRGGLKTVGFSYFSVGLDWRMIAPSPVWVLPNFGDFGKAIYRQAAKEGQIWIGVTFWR